MNSLFENIGTNWSVITHDIVNVYLPLFCIGFILLCVWSTRNYKRSLDQEKADELNTAQKQIDHLRLKNINQGIEIERLSDELKTANGVIKRLNDERQTLKPKRNPDGTFAVTTGKGHQRKRKPELEPERDWTQATKEELLSEAKRRYPVGTKIKSIVFNHDSGKMDISNKSEQVVGKYYWANGDKCPACHSTYENGETTFSALFIDGKWAQIIS